MRPMVFELRMMKKKKEEEKEERRIAKSKFSSLFFSASELGSKTLGALSVSVLAHLAVVITELLPYLKYRRPF